MSFDGLMSFIKLVRTVVVVAAAVAVAAVMTIPAQASTTVPLRHTTVKQGMYFEGFDAAVAKAHGYKIVTYANGDEQAVPVNPKSGLRKSPILTKNWSAGIHPANSASDTVTGDCGSSDISAIQISTNHIDVDSGFEVIDPVVYVDWDIYLSDVNGTSTQGTSDYLLDDVEWGHAWDDLYQYEDTIDSVSTGSYVIMTTGEECFSAGPFVVLTGLN
jgi:hypothetical protein